MTEPRPLGSFSRGGRWLAFAGLVLAAWLAYRACLEAPFIFDDRPAIERNASLRHFSTALRPPATAAGAAGRPLVNLSLALDYWFHGLDPRGYHATNLVLHLGVGLLLWAVVRRTLARVPALAATTDRVAWVTTLLWLVHPLTTESVVCVVQRNEILVASFLLATLYACARAAESTRPARWYVVAFVAGVLGAASKEVMAVAPLVVLIYDRTFFAGTWREAWRRRWPLYVALASSWLLLGWLVLGHAQRAGTVGFGLGTSAWDYLVTQSRALTCYLRLALWPHSLVLDYGFDLASLADVWPHALVVLALLAATTVAVWRRSPWGFAGTCFFLLLAPSSSIVPLTTQTIAEHRMYLPLAAIMALLATAVTRLPRGGMLALGSIAAVFIALTRERVDTYRSELRIWSDTVAHQPGNPRAHSSLAEILAREGRWDEALAHYAEAVRLRPDYADAQNDYANALVRVGRVDDALAHYATARRLKPEDDDVRYNLGIALVQAGRLDEAIDNFSAVVAREPQNAAAWNNLGDARLKRRDVPGALQAFEAATAADPNSAGAHNNAGIALVALGRFADAVPHYEAAARLLPDSAQVHHNFALALDGANRAADAIREEEIALRLNPNFAAAREHLAALRARH